MPTNKAIPTLVVALVIVEYQGTLQDTHTTIRKYFKNIWGEKICKHICDVIYMHIVCTLTPPSQVLETTYHEGSSYEIISKLYSQVPTG